MTQYYGYGGAYLYKRPKRWRKGDAPLPRRARLINGALLRSQRRWDRYTEKVRLEGLPWEMSKKTQEWRLVIQNGRLVRGLRRLPEYVPERNERLAEDRSNPLSLSKMWIPKGSVRRETSGSFGE